MKKTKMLKLIISIIIFFELINIGNLLYSNIVYAATTGNSLGNLNDYDGRKCRKCG